MESYPIMLQSSGCYMYSKTITDSSSTKLGKREIVTDGTLQNSNHTTSETPQQWGEAADYNSDSCKTPGREYRFKLTSDNEIARPEGEDNHSEAETGQQRSSETRRNDAHEGTTSCQS